MWIVYKGKVYDVSKFYPTHPGGPDVIMDVAGKDATAKFDEAGHTKANILELEQYLIGDYKAPRIFTKLDEVADHNQPNDLWLLINNKVYDVSNFKHPGKISVTLLTITRRQRDIGTECRHGCYYIVRRYQSHT